MFIPVPLLAIDICRYVSTRESLCYHPSDPGLVDIHNTLREWFALMKNYYKVFFLSICHALQGTASMITSRTASTPSTGRCGNAC
jgi:hypothetical protein